MMICATVFIALFSAGAPENYAADPITFDPPAELVAQGIVSSGYAEVRLAISPSGETMIWGSTDRPGGAGGWDLFESHREGEAWSPPAPISVDSPQNDFDPAFSPDGKSLYFFSNRPGGLGGDDIYRARFDESKRTFGPVEHLNANVNSPGDEWAPFFDGRGNLLFASDGRGGAGQHDLFLAPKRGSRFARAQALLGEVNGPDDDFDATFLADGRTLVFARSTDAATAPIALYVSRSIDGRFDAPRRLPDSINVADGWTLGPSIGPAVDDRKQLYFTSHRAEQAAGKLDIYRIGYRLD